MRTPRNQHNMPESAFFKPIDISKLGGPDDPCFGKLYEPANQDCHSCGDSELCAIAAMYKITDQRKKAGKKQEFKDDTEVVNKEKFMSTTKLITVIKGLTKKKPMRFKDLTESITKQYDPEGLMPHGRVEELCKIAITASKNLQKLKKDGKIYIKCNG